MKKGNAAALIGRLREKANRLIMSELDTFGIQGIVPSHGGILQVLFEEQECTMNELARRIQRTKPTVTVLVDKLVARGYVEKQKNAYDRRETLVSLTPKGMKLRSAFDTISNKLNNRIYCDLSEAEAETLENLLLRVNGNFP